VGAFAAGGGVGESGRRDGAEVSGVVDLVGDVVAGVGQGRGGQVEVQVRFGAIAGVADAGELLAFADVVADPHGRCDGLEVGVEGVAAVAEVQHDVVAAVVVQPRAGEDRAGRGVGQIRGDRDHGRVGDGQDRLVVGPVARGPGGIAAVGGDLAALQVHQRGGGQVEADPVDG